MINDNFHPDLRPKPTLYDREKAQKQLAELMETDPEFRKAVEWLQSPFGVDEEQESSAIILPFQGHPNSRK